MELRWTPFFWIAPMATPPRPLSVYAPRAFPPDVRLAPRTPSPMGHQVAASTFRHLLSGDLFRDFPGMVIAHPPIQRDPEWGEEQVFLMLDCALGSRAGDGTPHDFNYLAVRLADARSARNDLYLVDGQQRVRTALLTLAWAWAAVGHSMTRLTLPKPQAEAWAAWAQGVHAILCPQPSVPLMLLGTRQADVEYRDVLESVAKNNPSATFDLLRSLAKSRSAQATPFRKSVALVYNWLSRRVRVADPQVNDATVAMVCMDTVNRLLDCVLTVKLLNPGADLNDYYLLANTGGKKFSPDARIRTVLFSTYAQRRGDERTLLPLYENPLQAIVRKGVPQRDAKALWVRAITYALPLLHPHVSKPRAIKNPDEVFFHDLGVFAETATVGDIENLLVFSESVVEDLAALETGNGVTEAFMPTQSPMSPQTRHAAKSKAMGIEAAAKILVDLSQGQLWFPILAVKYLQGVGPALHLAEEFAKWELAMAASTAAKVRPKPAAFTSHAVCDLLAGAAKGGQWDLRHDFLARYRQIARDFFIDIRGTVFRQELVRSMKLLDQDKKLTAKGKTVQKLVARIFDGKWQGDVDHIMPRKPETGAPHPKVHHLGNLGVLPSGVNRSVRAMCFGKKRKVVAQMGLNAATRGVYAQASFTGKDIDRRGADMRATAASFIQAK